MGVVFEDSDAWLKSAHDAGSKFYDRHIGDGGAGAADLMRLGRSLFDPQDPRLTKLRSLQAELRVTFGLRDPDGRGGPPGTQGEVDHVNAWLRDNVCDVALSHAQMVCLWHLLVDQDDVKLISPWNPNRGW